MNSRIESRLLTFASAKSEYAFRFDLGHPNFSPKFMGDSEVGDLVGDFMVTDLR